MYCSPKYPVFNTLFSCSPENRAHDEPVPDCVPISNSFFSETCGRSKSEANRPERTLGASNWRKKVFFITYDNFFCRGNYFWPIFFEDISVKDNVFRVCEGETRNATMESSFLHLKKWQPIRSLVLFVFFSMAKRKQSCEKRSVYFRSRLQAVALFQPHINAGAEIY